MMCQKLFTCLFALMVFCVQAQQPKDTLAELYKPYQSAMGILVQSKRALPQDSVVFAKEWQRLDTRLKHLSDSIAANNTTKAPIYFEYQRLIDRVTYNTHKDSLQPHLNTLYGYTAKHQEALVENGPQFNKIAKCIMGVSKEDAFVESAVIAHNASLIRDLYKQLNTTAWDTKKHQDFISFFAAQYINTGSVRKTEKLYRHFDSLFVSETTTKDFKNFSLPDSLRFQNGTLALTPQSWTSLPKDKIVVQLFGQNMFDYVYLVSLLRTVHRNYASDYDVVLLRSTYEEHHAYLSNVKRNLAFDEYYIATGSGDALDTVSHLPAVFIVNAKNEVTYQATHTNSLFKKLNAPIEAAKALADDERLADLEQKKAALKQRAIRTQDSISYQDTHQKIRFILKGVWEEDLSTQLTPVQWKEINSLPVNTYPYMATFEVIHPQYRVYELLVLVTGKKQNITITSGDLYKKTVSYAQTKNAQFHEAIQTIDKSQSLQTTYAYLLDNYPFKETAFMTYIAAQATTAKIQEEEAISSVKKASELLQHYADAKREEGRQMR